MDNATFWIAIVGLVATNITSAIGFYFAHKSQRSPLREQLYGKQLEILVEFSTSALRLQQLANALRDSADLSADDLHALDEAWDEVSSHLLEIVQRAGILLPTDLYSAMTAYRACCHEFEEAIVKKVNVGKAFNDLGGAYGHIFMMSRELAGADNLSVESLNLHSRDGYQRMQQVGRVSMARVFGRLRPIHGRTTPPE